MRRKSSQAARNEKILKRIREVNNHCKGCGERTEYVYCDSCAADAKCPHENPVSDCDACDLLSDQAYDGAG